MAEMTPKDKEIYVRKMIRNGDARHLIGFAEILVDNRIASEHSIIALIDICSNHVKAKELWDSYIAELNPDADAPKPKNGQAKNRKIASSDDLVELWSGVMVHMKSKLGANIAAYLDSAIPSEVNDEKIVIGFTTEWHLAKANEVKGRFNMQEFFNKIMDKPRTLEYIHMPQGFPTSHGKWSMPNSGVQKGPLSQETIDKIEQESLANAPETTPYVPDSERPSIFSVKSQYENAIIPEELVSVSSDEDMIYKS